MIKPLLATPISSDRLWEISFFLITLYLLFFPPLSFLQSYAVALGGGLFLLLFRTVPQEAFQGSGRVFLFFLLFLPLSALWSLQPGITLQSAGFFFLGSLLYWMIRSNETGAQSRMEIGGLLLAGLAALSALRQWLFGFDETRELLPHLSRLEFLEVQKAVFYHRATGPLVTPGALAALMILFIPLGFTLAAVGTGFKKWFFGLLTALLGLALLATQSVGAFAALAMACLLVLVARRAWAGVGGVLALGLAAMGGVIWARGLQHWDISSFSGRLGLWGHAFQLFLAHPLLGSGLGTFGEAYQQAGFPLDSGASKFAHNILLQLLVETGLVGMGFFLWAVASLIRRFKVPARWEGWGAMTGALAFLLFSLVDLPFQMPELIWFFVLVLGRLECRPEKPIALPVVPLRCLEYGLLLVLLAAGFLPPYSKIGFCLLGLALWGMAAFLNRKLEGLPLWIALGCLYLALRAFVSPSASGTVLFYEITGLALAFYLVVSAWPETDKFLKGFFACGLAWAVVPWWISFRYGFQSFRSWLSFQYSDMKGFMVFHDPKQVAIFLLPLVFILWRKPRKGLGFLAIGLSLLTMVRLRAMAAVLGLGAGILASVKARHRIWVWIAAGSFLAGLVFLRALDPSSTRWERFGIWESALKVWAMDPWVGVGPGAFSGYYHLFKTPRATGVNRYLMDAQIAHNEFLEYLTAFGLVGLAFGLLWLWSLWRKIKEPSRRSSLAALGAAAWVDFGFHNPMIALQGTGLLTQGRPSREKPSYAAAFLALGLGLGLFGAPTFSKSLIQQSMGSIAQKQYPEALRCLQQAERLDAWNVEAAGQKAAYFEMNYLLTKNPDSAREADEDFDRVLRLEQADGQLKYEQAQWLTERLVLDSSPAAVQAAQESWTQAEQAMPFNALIRYEEGLFLLHRGDKEGALLNFQKASELEPNYAAAWANLGLLLKEKGDKAGAHSAFRTALGVYNQWKDAQRISDTEMEMVSLPEATVEFLEQQTAKNE